MVVLSVPPRGWVKPYVVTSHVLSAAIQNKVEYLVSGDKKHILPLKNHPDIKRLGIRVVSRLRDVP